MQLAGGLLGAGLALGPGPGPRNLSLESDTDFQGFLSARGAPAGSSGPGTPNTAPLDSTAAADAVPSDPLALMFTLALELHHRLSAEESISMLQAKQLGMLGQASGVLHRRMDAVDQGLRAEMEALRGEAAAVGSAARQVGASAAALHGRVAAAEQEAARAKAALLTAQCEIRALTGTVMQLVSVAESHAEALRQAAPDKLPAAVGAEAQAGQRVGNGHVANWNPPYSGESDLRDGEAPLATPH